MVTRMCMRLNAILASVVVITSACSGQSTPPKAVPSAGGPPGAQPATVVTGDTVTEMSKALWIVFQDTKNNRWFGSDGQGVYRSDGKTITQFTTKHGLPNDQIREIQQDKSGNIYIGTCGGISRFDGKTFTTLTPIESTDWKMTPDDLWFKGASTETGPYRYDGTSLYHLKFPKHYLEDEFFSKNERRPWSPYGVYTIYKDKRGHLWFGTASLGLCRYDGKTVSWLYEVPLTNAPTGGSIGIRSIVEDKNGKYWFSNTQYRYSIAPGEAATSGPGRLGYTREPGIEGHKAADGDLWYFSSVVEDKGNLWMASYGDGVLKYDGKGVIRYAVTDGGKATTVFSISKDNQGVLWLGTHAAGAYRFNGKEFEQFRP